MHLNYSYFTLDVTLRKHRAYESALQIITGLAFHNNDGSRYVPLYLNTYAESMDLLPPFLIASTNPGYQIPKEIHELLEFLLKSDDALLHSDDLNVKRTFFENRMGSLYTQIIKDSHPGCHKEYCIKVSI